MAKGWKQESVRHSLARKGIKTGNKSTKRVTPNKVSKPNYDKQTDEIFKKLREEFDVQRNSDDFWDNFSDEFKEKIKEALKEGKSPEEAKDSVLDDAQIYSQEGNPVSTIFIFENGKEEKIIISEYELYDETDGQYGEDFKPKWHKTGGWRGYYEIEAKGWTPIHEDTALAYSEDSRQLKNFDDALVDEIKNRGIPLARAVSVTSNLFSSSADYFVPDAYASDVEGIVKKLKEQYRDPKRFRETALTGKDPKDMTKTDKKFVRVATMVQAGVKPKSALAFDDIITKETKRDEFKKVKK